MSAFPPSGTTGNHVLQKVRSRAVGASAYMQGS